MKKLIIVCEKKYRVYGDYLSQLISLRDDTENETVGVKDGEVVAQVWLEKDYNNNSATISSSQPIIFIGYSDMIKKKSRLIKKKFSKYGITYGWLGNQAVLFVDKVVSAKKYNDFIEDAQNYRDDLEKLIKQKENKTKTEKVLEVAGKAVGVGALAIWGGALAIAPLVGVSVFNKISLNKKIEQQQYTFAVMKFYFDSLGEFLGL